MASTSKSPFSDDLLPARIDDALRLCTDREYPCFLGFLDEHQRAAAERRLLHCSQVFVMFWGGFDQAERTLLGVFPSWYSPDAKLFPLTAVGFSYRPEASISHRDVLGTLLSTGIRREAVGDILSQNGLSVAFLKEEMVSFLTGQIARIGGEAVKVTVPFEGELPSAHTFKEWRDTVASPRLDAVLKVCLHTSREEAARQIAAGLVSLNHTECLSVSAEVKEGDVISVRGAGRFRVDGIGPVTRKGRIFITINQYI